MIRGALPKDLVVRPADWERDYREIRNVRSAVFINEQAVPEDLEIDGKDEHCSHVLAMAGDRGVGTARMQKDGHIGRVAVKQPWRRRGIGTRLMEELFATARRSGLKQVYLNSQVQATLFYENLGFHKKGTVFMEADMPHVKMVRTIHHQASGVSSSSG